MGADARGARLVKADVTDAALMNEFKAADDDFEMIETLYGVGYRFKEM